ncbi:gfo/Idh/MocA family oxidoreductase [Jiangella rhizosphaerae]|uniref:Gfo/Idh/MocA family oxidoreductase n=2 Tax=Jiangella rhizosphaerae TaxID=2293569 RepID=A0A418KM32_9ACTN|nr:gfo/Idh/MocA family oxidoreductase [Jiangella rhizosphaerae]
MQQAHHVRLGVVGTGLMGRAAAIAAVSHVDVTVTALANRSRPGADGLADDLRATGRDRPEVFDRLDDLLAAGVVDALIVATPDDQHADAVVAAAAAGVHVLVEKPFATRIDDAERALKAVRHAGTLGMCLFNHRWVPAYAQAKELAADLGAPVLAYARKNDTLHVPTQMLSWAENTTCAWFLSSHDIDLVTWLFDDDVAEVVASSRSGVLRARGIDTPDAVQIQCRFAGGAVATFESCWIYPDTFPTMTDSFVEVVYENGVVQLDRLAENITVADHTAYRHPRNVLLRTLHGRPSGAYHDAIRHFIDCVRTGAAPLVTLESSRHVTAVLAAAHESLRTGAPVRVAGAEG